MAALQLHIYSGPGAGRKTTFAQSPVTFGRDQDNTVILPDSTVSRHHGELQLQGDQWMLVNRSPNGTRVNRRNITDKPAPLGDKDTIYIGDQPVFQVFLVAQAATAVPSGPLTPSDTPTTPVPAATSSAAPGSSGPVKVPLSHKASTWAWIGLSFGVILLVVAAFSDVLSPAKTDTVTSRAPELTPAQIEAEISRSLPAPRGVDLPRANQALARAQHGYPVPSTAPERLFPIYRDYQEYLAYSGRDRLDPDDELHFREIQRRLIDEVTKQYQAACSLISSPDRVSTEFSKVKRLYNDPASEIFQNSDAHIRQALEKQKTRKRGLF